MTGFVESIVSRFAGAENIIIPRLPGRFESSYHDESNLVDDSRPGVESHSEDASAIEHQHRDETVNTRSSNVDHDPVGYKNNSTDRTVNSYTAVDNSNTSLRRRANDNVQEDQRRDRLSERKERPSEFDRQLIRPDLDSYDEDGVDNRIQNINTHRRDFTPFVEDERRDSMTHRERISLLVEKENQRSEIRPSVILPVMPELPKKNQERIADLNFRTDALQDRAPVVKISIGRIEVRAVPSTNGSKPRENPSQKPQMSLDEYLQKRNKGH
jgi:hypothetical protein